MRLTVLGKSPSWQDADGACSGYLIEEGETSVVLDCGNGVFSKLRRYRDYTRVDAVVISHLHADHILDLVPFASALIYAPRQQPEPVESGFELREYAPADELAVGGLRVRFHEVPHFLTTFAVGISSANGGGRF